MGLVMKKKSDSGKIEGSGMPVVMFVATTPFAVNAFLANHIVALAKHYKIILCTNLNAYELSPLLLTQAEVFQINFSRKVSLYQDLKSILQLFMVVCQNKPTVIHSITPKAGLLAMFTGLVMRVPHRWHTFTGQVWATRKGLSRRLLMKLDKLIVLMASRVFVDSTSQGRLLCDEGIVRDDQIGMLGFGSIAGVDLSRFQPDNITRDRLRKKIGTPVNAYVFLFVGRLTRDKGIFDLIDAFRIISISESNIELWVVGPDEDELLKILKDSAQGCTAPIRWLGSTETPEYFMASADALLLPSHREGFGSVIIEAAACGIPTIAYRIDGVIDAVKHESTGILVDAHEVEAFAEAMKSLKLNSSLSVSLGNRAKERARLDFSSDVVTRAWLKFYQSHLGI
jgi:glycosyltransferase involved in cell wall biosynthesis